MDENAEVEDMDANCRKRRLKELLDVGGQIRLTNDTEETVLTIDKISNIIKETEKIHKHGDVKVRATNTTEIVMDAQVIQMTHELMGEVIDKMGSTEFSDEEWINSMIGLVYKDANENWDLLYNLSNKISKTAKYSSFLLGGFDLQRDIPQTIERAQRRAKNNKSSEEVKPENVTNLEKQDTNTDSVKLIFRQILNLYIKNNHTPIAYYKLIIDPDNYMKTVDNAFKVAFLARDKSVAIELGDDNLPNIRPLSNKDKCNASSETVQAICSVNPKIIRDMIQKYEIEKSILTQTVEE